MIDNIVEMDFDIYYLQIMSRAMEFTYANPRLCMNYFSIWKAALQDFRNESDTFRSERVRSYSATVR
jgi:hypothetical protein